MIPRLLLLLLSISVLTFLVFFCFTLFSHFRAVVKLTNVGSAFERTLK